MTNKKLKLDENESIQDGKFHIVENFNVKAKVDKTNQVITTEAFEESKAGTKKIILRPRIEAIHAGRTRNNNIYPAERLKGDFKNRSGCYSFVHPYPKPMLKNHDHESEPTGRIKNAQFVSDTATGKEAIIIVPEITDPDTIEKVLDGRYMTVSIGASTDSATCNICGTNIIEEWCGHVKGVEYDGTVCGWITGELYFDECSWVNVPADSDARVINTGESELEESFMEAYVELEDKIYDLGVEEGISEVKPLLAESLGLKSSTDDLEGGKNTVSKPKVDPALEESVDSLKVIIAEKDEAIILKDAEVAEKTATIEANEATILEKETLITEKDASLAEKDQKIEESAVEIAELKESIETLEAEKELAESTIAEYKAIIHRNLAEKVYEYRVFLRKPVKENKEEAITELIERSEDSLKDSLADLEEELATVNTITIGSVVNPAIGSTENTLKSKTVDVEGNIITGASTEEELDTEKVLINLFKGKIK